MREYVSTRLREILAGGGGQTFAHLSPADRRATAEILRRTKPDLWTAASE